MYITSRRQDALERAIKSHDPKEGGEIIALSPCDVTKKSDLEKMYEELSKKEKYIEELGSSAEKRLNSMNSAYNGLRQKFEEQQSQQQRLDDDHETALRLEAELYAV